MIAWATYPYDATRVLVTGGGSGIGRALARAFLEQGARVAVAGRHRDTLRDTVQGCPADRYLILAGDMAVRGSAGIVWIP